MDDDAESIITNERYVYISSVIDGCYKKAAGREKLTVSDKIDKIVTNRFAALRFSLGNVSGVLCICHHRGYLGDGLGK